MSLHEKEFCSAHAEVSAIARRNPWTNKKLIGAVIALLASCGSLIGWFAIQARSAKAETATLSEQLPTLYIEKDEFIAGQRAQDTALTTQTALTVSQMNVVEQKLEKVESKVDVQTEVLYEIKGQLKAVAGKIGVREPSS